MRAFLMEMSRSAVALTGGPWPALAARVAVLAALAWALARLVVPDAIEARSAAVAGVGAGLIALLVAGHFARRRWPDRFGR